MLSAPKITTYEYNKNIIIATVRTFDGKVFVGKAKYNPQDKEAGIPFNKEIGEKIARARAIDKMISSNEAHMVKKENKLHKDYVEKLKLYKKEWDRIAFQDEKNSKQYDIVEKYLSSY